MQKSTLIPTLIISVIVPALVAVMYLFNLELTFIEKETLQMFPKINAIINTLTSVCLIMGVFWIKRGRVGAHRMSMISAMTLGVCFLVLYVLYHSGISGTPYPADAPNRGIYFFLLITHIVLAALVLPFILFTFFRAYFGDFEKHKKIAIYTYPIWLYVSLSGVVVYLMISPYYGFN